MKRMLIVLLMCTPIITGINCKDTIDVVGRIYIVGNEPFTEVAIEVEDGKTYIIVGEVADSLRKMQGEIVEIKGKLKGKTSHTKQSIYVVEYKRCK
ncbi:MAG TPA: hypothetical protein EYP60_05725 [bacterium (Candidatus Stahlbacteria)]|nr:hypothetical protein [Candidatus Stahlbacteria bacterium]